MTKLIKYIYGSPSKIINPLQYFQPFFLSDYNHETLFCYTPPFGSQRAGIGTSRSPSTCTGLNRFGWWMDVWFVQPRLRCWSIWLTVLYTYLSCFSPIFACGLAVARNGSLYDVIKKKTGIKIKNVWVLISQIGSVR